MSVEAGGFPIIELAARDLPQPYATAFCKKCPAQSTIGYLARVIKANGSIGLRWVCNHCEDYGTAGDLPHELVRARGLTVGDLPIRARAETLELPDCAVCGNDLVEYHHWAPRAIFADWPEVGAYLCKTHHDDWHSRMRKHGLRWPHEEQEAA